MGTGHFSNSPEREEGEGEALQDVFRSGVGTAAGQAGQPRRLHRLGRWVPALTCKYIPTLLPGMYLMKLSAVNLNFCHSFVLALKYCCREQDRYDQPVIKK